MMNMKGEENKTKNNMNNKKVQKTDEGGKEVENSVMTIKKRESS